MASTFNQAVDYGKDYTQQDKYSILNHYFPGKFEKADLESTEENPVLTKALDMSKDLFEKEKAANFQKKETEKQNLIENTEKVRSSIAKSLEKLKTSYPGMSKTAIANVSKSMANGEYRKLFFNTDGTFTDEAAGRLAMAMYGDEEIRNATKKATNKAQSDTTKKIVERTDDKASIKTDGAASPAPNKDQAQVKSLMDSILKKRNVYEARLA